VNVPKYRCRNVRYGFESVAISASIVP